MKKKKMPASVLCPIIFFMLKTKEPKLDSKGDAQQAIVDEMKDIAVDFLKRLYAVKTLRILDYEIKIKSVFLKSDSNRTGVNVSLDIEERQAHCL